MIEYRNSTVIMLIDEYIHNDEHRGILVDRLVRGMTYEQISEKHFLSVSQTKRIIYKGQDKIFKHLKMG